MFEPFKLISVGVALLLLAPFGFVFWVIATVGPEAERRAQLEAAVRDQSIGLGTTNADDDFVEGAGVTIRESLAFSTRHGTLLEIYPRRWVGWLGLAAVATIAFCIVLSLFFPRSNEISASRWNKPPAPQAPTR